MTAKHQLAMTACALILTAGVANAGPCNTTGIGTVSRQRTGRPKLTSGRNMHSRVSPSNRRVPARPSSRTLPKSAVPSAKMTDQDQSSASPPRGSETSTKMADQGC